MFTPEICSADHGLLRVFLGNGQNFSILNMRRHEYLLAGSGSHGGMNPDVYWCHQADGREHARTIFEVGVTQSLPSLRRRGYELCAYQGI